MCFCYSWMDEILDAIHEYAGGNWNMICSGNKHLLKMNAYAKDGKYIYIGPLNCFYGIYLF